MNIFEIIADFARAQLLGTQTDRENAAKLFGASTPIDTNVDSSALTKVSYDPTSLVLELDFESGHVYQYFNVRQEVADGLVNASSVGRYYNNIIKGGFYPYRRLI